MEPQDLEKERYFLKSLAKGLAVLQTIAEAGQPLTLSEIARSNHTNNATATRITYTLGQLGFVSRDRSRRYRLTPKVLSLGYAAVSSQGWRKAAQHYLEKLSEQSGETANLSVLEGNEIVYVGRVNTGRILPFDLQLGSRLPLHCTAMGKVLAAFRPPDQLQKLLENMDFAPLTHRTISSREGFLAALAEVRQKGYAINDEELSVGLRSVAAPIRDSKGWARAAINLAVPTKKVSRAELVSRFTPMVLAAAAETESALANLE